MKIFARTKESDPLIIGRELGATTDYPVALEVQSAVRQIERRSKFFGITGKLMFIGGLIMIGVTTYCLYSHGNVDLPTSITTMDIPHSVLERLGAADAKSVAEYPFESPVRALLDSMAGPTARIIATLVLAFAGLMLAMGSATSLSSMLAGIALMVLISGSLLPAMLPATGDSTVPRLQLTLDAKDWPAAIAIMDKDSTALERMYVRLQRDMLVGETKNSQAMADEMLGNRDFPKLGANPRQLFAIEQALFGQVKSKAAQDYKAVAIAETEHEVSTWTSRRVLSVWSALFGFALLGIGHIFRNRARRIRSMIGVL